MALRGLHGVMGFIWDLRATAESWKTSAFHGTVVLIVTALSPWPAPGRVTHEFFVFVFLDDNKMILFVFVVLQQNTPVVISHELTLHLKFTVPVLDPRSKIIKEIQSPYIWFKIISAFLFEEKLQSTGLIDILKACQLADLQSWHQRPCLIGLLLKYSVSPLRAAASSNVSTAENYIGLSKEIYGNKDMKVINSGLGDNLCVTSNRRLLNVTSS